MKRNLAVVLQEEAQQEIFKYLNIRSQQVEQYTYNNADEIFRYSKFAKYLERAAELLGQQHYMYKDLLSRMNYFRGGAWSHKASENIDKREAFFRKGLAAFEEGLKLQPNSPHILVQIGISYHYLNKPEKAKGYYEKAIALSPAWPIPYEELATDYFLDRNFKKTIEYCNKLLAIQPGYENAFSLKIEAYHLLKKYDEIVEDCKAALKENPDYLIAHLELAKIYAMNGEVEKAKHSIRNATQITVTNFNTWRAMGEVYFIIGEKDKAKSSLRKAISLNPYDYYTYNLYGSLFIEEGALDSAAIMFQQILEYYPDEYIAMLNLGLIKLNQNDFQQALKYFNNADEITDQDPIVAFCFFCYHFQNGKTVKAFRKLEQAFQYGLYDYLESPEVVKSDCLKSIINTTKFKNMKEKFKPG